MPHVTIQAQNEVDTNDPLLDLIMRLPVRLQREALDWLLVNACIGRSTLRLLNVCYADERADVTRPNALYWRKMNVG